MGVLLATKHLLQLYFVVRVLLVIWKKEVETGDCSLCGRSDNQSGDYNCYAGKQGAVWGADHAGKLYAVYDSFGKGIKENESLCGLSGFSFGVFIYEEY